MNLIQQTKIWIAVRTSPEKKDDLPIDKRVSVCYNKDVK